LKKQRPIQGYGAGSDDNDDYDYEDDEIKRISFVLSFVIAIRQTV
jgi:hypothetical protein